MAKRKSSDPSAIMQAAEAMGAAVGKALAALDSAAARKRRPRRIPAVDRQRAQSGDRARHRSSSATAPRRTAARPAARSAKKAR